MITLIFAVLSRTPLWVWALLAALVALGLLQARDHVLPRARVLIQPLALGALSRYGAASAFGLHALPLGGWLAGLALGAALNQPLRLPRQVQALPDGRFRVGGSWAPLGLLMVIFWLRYSVAVALAMVPARRAAGICGGSLPAVRRGHRPAWRPGLAGVAAAPGARPADPRAGLRRR